MYNIAHFLTNRFRQSVLRDLRKKATCRLHRLTLKTGSGEGLTNEIVLYPFGDFIWR